MDGESEVEYDVSRLIMSLNFDEFCVYDMVSIVAIQLLPT